MSDTTITVWEDKNNRSYKVIQEYGKYRVCYLESGDDNYIWKPCKNFKPKDTFREANLELKNWAKKNNMRVLGNFEDVVF